ncbi:hypothetical protein BDN72DRAFT_965696 [Pluteus cervinus]|uniref:Uncharacterized protein n=1 Tax=Pluteus cervinus TaxID=181527 RepID=A0ACD3A3H1_9AGAR|nr:hypothetical protein BDN72DRAFT_965696 [Pluteus cervinus]
MTHRVLTIPELLRNIFFSLPGGTHRDTYYATLVCHTWSEIALDVLWYEVDDICTLFNLLVPLIKLETDPPAGRKNQACHAEDWVRFEKYSRRVKMLAIESTTILPSPSVFDDIVRTRIRHEILPNLWSLRWLSDPSQGAIFLHSGIQELAFLINFDHIEEAKIFIRNACFSSRNITTLEIEVGSEGDSTAAPHPVECIEAELSSWFAQLQDIRWLFLPKFWHTSRLCRLLSQLPNLVHLGFKFGGLNYGNPLDTMAFIPISNGEKLVFPSLTKLSQNTPFSEMTRFLSSWQGSCQLQELTVASQILESPDGFRSALDVITTECPQLTWLGLTCLTTIYRHHPRGASHPRITLDTLLQLHKLKGLTSLEITHTLPFALTDEDFLVLVREWSQMESLRFGYDSFPLANDTIHIAESPLSPPPTDGVRNSSPTPLHPVMGLWNSVKALRTHCPQLIELYLFGIDDFPIQDNRTSQLADDEFAPSPFPDLTVLSFGTSLITSKKAAVAMALSRYISYGVTFIILPTWGGDQESPYLTYLNLKPLIPLRNEVRPTIQKLIDSADPAPSNPVWARPSHSNPLNEPIGVNGIVDEDTGLEIDKRMKLLEDVFSLLPILSAARHDEREQVKRQGTSNHVYA